MLSNAPTVTDELARLRESRAKYSAQTHADLTLRGYDYDWRTFEQWCAGIGLTAFPCVPETLGLYATSLLDAGKKITTTQRRVCAVSHRHVIRGLAVEKEKQDQDGKGRLIGVPHGKYEETCAVKALTQWIEMRGPGEGPLFIRLNPARRGHPMDGQTVHRIVQKRVHGLEGIPGDRWGAHSLRAGLVTAGAEAGVSELVIGAQSGHRSSEMIRRYYRRVNLFKANVCYSLDL